MSTGMNDALYGLRWFMYEWNSYQHERNLRARGVAQSARFDFLAAAGRDLADALTRHVEG